MIRLTALLLFVLALPACAALENPTLDGTEWLSVRRTDAGEDWPLVEGTQIRLRFDDGSVGGSAGCNTIGGSYRIESGQLVTDALAMTEMGCDEPRHEQDDWLGGFLGSRPTLALAGTELTLTSGDVVVALENREIAEPDLPLVDTTWTVESLISRDTVSTVPGDAVATIVFRDDGTIEVDSGCNTGGGRYSLEGSVLQVRELVTTEIGCDGPAGQLERAVFDVLGSETIEVAIEAGSLTLTAGDVGLGLRGD